MAKVKRTIYDLLKGKFLVDEDAPKNWSMLVFLTGLALVMIASSHNIDKKVNKIAELNKEMKKLQSVYVATRSDLMKIKIESAIVQRIEKEGLYMAENPPQKIVYTIKE